MQSNFSLIGQWLKNTSRLLFIKIIASNIIALYSPKLKSPASILRVTLIGIFFFFESIRLSPAVSEVLGLRTGWHALPSEHPEVCTASTDSMSLFKT